MVDRASWEAIKLAEEIRARLRVVHVVDEVSLDWPSETAPAHAGDCAHTSSIKR